MCKPPFACQNVLKLTYSNLEFQNFTGRTPGPPSSRGGDGRGREGRRGRGKGSKGGRGGRDGKGHGRKGGREGRNGGVVGRGGEGHSTWAPPPSLVTSSGSAPAFQRRTPGLFWCACSSRQRRRSGVIGGAGLRDPQTTERTGLGAVDPTKTSSPCC